MLTLLIMIMIVMTLTVLDIFNSSPNMWWRLIVLVLSIVIIILLQQLDVNALQSPIFIQSSLNSI